MTAKFYTLLYIDENETRLLSGRTYLSKARIQLFLKNAICLDKSLRMNTNSDLTILTNNKMLLESMAKEIGAVVNILDISFDFPVPKGIPFYSAHFKIDVFKYFSSKPVDEYSILMDNDVICLHDFPSEFYQCIERNTPLCYLLPRYEQRVMADDISKIDASSSVLEWAGGEFVGGGVIFIIGCILEFQKLVHPIFNQLPPAYSI